MSDNRAFPSQVHVLNHPLVKDKITRLRNKSASGKEFRDLVSEITHLVCYQATADLPLEDVEVETPLMTTTGARVAGRQAIVPILRAGLGMQEAMLSMLPTAQVQHIGLYRDEVVLAPVEYYNKLPSICTVSQIYLLDPMLATAGSACAAVDILKSWAETSATPVQIKFLCIMAAPEGIAKFTARHPDVEVFVAQVDQCLNEKGYILPGLGDCGDKLFGTTPSTIRPRKASNASNK